jgi:hypothetical protein
VVAPAKTANLVAGGLVALAEEGETQILMVEAPTMHRRQQLVLVVPRMPSFGEHQNLRAVI